MRKVRKAIDDTIERWNPFTGDNPLLVPGNALPPPETSPYAGRGTEFDARKFWGRPLQEGAPSDGDAYLWNAALEQFVLGAAAGGESEPGIGFMAHGASDQDIDSTPITFLATTQNWDLGGLYNAPAAQWTPPAGPVLFLFHIRSSTSSIQPVIGVYKNGGPGWVKSGGRYSYLGDGWTEGVWIDYAGGTDVYEIRVSIHPDDVGEPGSIVAGESFWAGIAIQAGGGGSGGGIGPLTGDVTTSGNAATIAALHGIPITTTAPTDGESLYYDASINTLVWRPVTLTTPEDAITSGGDLVTSGGIYVIASP